MRKTLGIRPWLLALVACATVPPPPLPPPPPPRPPERADLRAVLLGEIQRKGVTEDRAGLSLHDPYRLVERGGRLVDAWLDHERERAETQLPRDAELVERLRARDEEHAARDLAPTRAGVFVEEVSAAGRRLRALHRDEGGVAADALVELAPDTLAYAPSPDGARIAVVRRATRGAELVVLASESGAVVDGPVADVAAVAPAWESESAFLYVRNGADSRVHRRRIGATSDPVVLASVPATDGIRLGVAEGVAWVEAQRGEERTLWLRAGTSHFRRLPTLGAGARAVVFGGRLAVPEAAEGAIRVAPLAQASRAAAWSRVLVPGVGAVAPLGDALLVQVRERVGDGLRVLRGDGTLETIGAPGAGVVRAVAGDAEGAWVAWSDPMTPGALLRLDVDDDAARWVSGPPGARLRTSRRTLVTHGPGDETRPLELLEVVASDAPGELAVVETLGAFGASALPSFRAGVAAFLEAGGRWVFVDVRGGGGVGSAWHEEGRGTGERRAVGDLQVAVEALRGEGRRVVAYGAGHGGLTAAGLLAREPELLSGVILHGPVTDLVRFEHFPNAALWRLEYGAPDDDDDALRALHGISPYHRLEPRRPRPPVLIDAARERERVSWVHGAKLAARLAEASSGPVNGPGLRANDVALHVDAALDDDARLARWARALVFLAALE